MHPLMTVDAFCAYFHSENLDIFRRYLSYSFGKPRHKILKVSMSPRSKRAMEAWRCTPDFLGTNRRHMVLSNILKKELAQAE